MALSKTPAKSANAEAAAPLDTGLVRQLADILKETELTEIEVERGDLRIRVARELTVLAQAAPVATVAAAPPAPSAAAPAAQTSEASAPASAPARASGETVSSPMVGTVYLQPQPGAPAFAAVGDTVKAGQTLLIIEAMKTMNPIPAPRDGKVVEVLVGDAQPVEFGEPLVVLA